MTSSPEPTMATVSAYNSGAAEYSRHSADRGAMTRLHERFVSFLTPGSSVLELGCGPGHDAAALAERGFSVTALDPARGLLGEARQHASIANRLIQGDSRELPFAAGSFAGAWACASLLHLPKGEVPAALGEAWRCLESGGVLFTSMQHGQGEGIEDLSLGLPVRYYYFYEADEWQRLVEEAGFAVIDQRVNPTSSSLTEGANGWIETFARKP